MHNLKKCLATYLQIIFNVIDVFEVYQNLDIQNDFVSSSRSTVKIDIAFTISNDPQGSVYT